MIIFPEDLNYDKINRRSSGTPTQGDNVGHSKDSTYIIDYPDHFAPEKYKGTVEYIKPTIDYYSNYAKEVYRYKHEKFHRNYELLKGRLSAKDLYIETEQELDRETHGECGRATG